MTTRVVCHQLAPRVGDPAGNRARAERALARSRALGADLVVLPELVTCGYPFESAAEVHVAAIGRDDPLFARWRSMIGSAVLVFGFAEAGADGEVYNSAAVLEAGKDPVWYRKTHLWDTEKLWFTPGDEPPPVVQTAVGRLAVMVCYDMEFPEMTRAVALRDADVLAVPANWPYVYRPEGLPAPEVVIAMAAARVNRLPIACCDRGGDDRGTRWNEASTIIGADGWPVATAGADGVAVADLDLRAGADKRISTRNDVHRDRRTDVYG